MKVKRDPLAVERAELLQIIGELGIVVEGLQDVDARVSPRFAVDLQRLQKQVASPVSPQKLRCLQMLVLELLAKIAAELLLKAFM